MLPGSGLGDDAALAHPPASSACPRVLLILWAPVWQIFPLKVDGRAFQGRGEAAGR